MPIHKILATHTQTAIVDFTGNDTIPAGDTGQVDFTYQFVATNNYPDNPLYQPYSSNGPGSGFDNGGVGNYLYGASVIGQEQFRQLKLILLP